MKKEHTEESLVKEINFHKNHLQFLQQKLSTIKEEKFPNPVPGMIFFDKKEKKSFVVRTYENGNFRLFDIEKGNYLAEKKREEYAGELEYIGKLSDIIDELKKGEKEGIRILGDRAKGMVVSDLIYEAFKRGRELGPEL